MATGTGVTTRGNASLLVRYTTACPFRLPGSFMTCLVCLSTFREPEEFRKHMKDEYPKLRRSLSCISSNYDVKVDITELNCRICSKNFETLEDIADHLNSAHSIGLDLKLKLGLQPFKLYSNNYSCLVCGEKCNDIRSLSRHSQKHNMNYTCETCGKAYGNEASVRVHAKYSHGKYKTYCMKCRKGFDSSEEKKTHMLGSQRCWPYVCNYCGLRCITKNSKTSHMISEHDHKPPLYNCPECPEIFTHKSMQIRHFNTAHTDKFQCPNCEKKFSCKKELNDHLVSHTAEKLYECDVCFKAFTRLKTLKAHMWNHMEKKRFECKQCNKQFNQRVSWKTHMSSYHPNQSLLQ
ncbi:Uncharacterized protein OBRU01_06186 [Operophtera brumata]|uniref:C2H2-type domain-containing protein n=1 Tax=Operophtera brumata TaxID=104452 RepID=A0A0L7LLY0_OPEBR|nr:Uncharacterized protein OBRU01_06186 [Operophtera brumata]